MAYPVRIRSSLTLRVGIWDRFQETILTKRSLHRGLPSRSFATTLMLMNDLRIALAQMNCPVGALEANLDKHRALAEQAATREAAAICFPECSLTGYPRYDDVAMKEHAQTLDGPLARAMVELSARSGILVLAGFIEAGDNCVYNTQIVAGSGELLGSYRKVHLCAPEAAFFAAGSDLPVWKYNRTTFGVQICFDNHFAEAARVLALRGAEVIFCPYGSPGPCTEEGGDAKRARWLRYQPARAFDNSMYLCVVNQVGATGYPPADDGDLKSKPEDTHCGVAEFPGGSMVINPWGEVIAQAKAAAEDLLIVDLPAEPRQQKMQDKIQDFRRYRRPELYGDLTKDI